MTVGFDTTNAPTAKWRDSFLSGAIIFGAQIVFELAVLLPSGELPSAFELYSSCITSAVSALAFHGYNMYQVKKYADNKAELKAEVEASAAK